jgi:hypothetical protein
MDYIHNIKTDEISKRSQKNKPNRLEDTFIFQNKNFE